MEKNNLVDKLRCSTLLRQPSVSETKWFNLQDRPGLHPVPSGDSVPAVSRPRCASLALVLREENGKVEMLVIKRATSLRDKWSGHIALPGGRQEIGETELQAAVRECREEVGLSLASSRFALLGRLEDSKTSTGKDALTVSCFVFLQTDGIQAPLAVQTSEVAFAWWVDTAMFYPNPAPQEVGFAVTSMVKAARKPHWKVLMWLFRAETVFFPCFFLPPPPASGWPPLQDCAASSIPMEYPLNETTFVMWGLTFGVVSNLVVTGGGRPFACQGPPYFRFRGKAADFLVGSFYTLKRWTSGLGVTMRLRQS
ncbi:unnamed protein product [Scytosiphon promiscuus]